VHIIRQPVLLPVGHSGSVATELCQYLSATSEFLMEYTYLLTYSVALVCKRTIPTERPPIVGEVSASFCG
jgi:hypothetical protein